MVDLVLDAEIRSNVLLPIMFVMFCLSVLRIHLTGIFSGGPEKQTLEKVYDAQITLRTRCLITHGSYVSPLAFAHRKIWFNHPQNGLLTKKSIKVGDGPDVSKMDPASMMKGQFSMLLTNLYMFSVYNIIDSLFSGFVAAKLPFALFRGWKTMLQAGIDLADLEVSYISSSSWYLLNFGGMNGVNEVLLGQKMDVNMTGMTGMAPVAQQQQNPMMGQDNSKIFQAQKDNLEVKLYSWEADASLARLAAYAKGKRSNLASAAREKKASPSLKGRKEKTL